MFASNAPRTRLSLRHALAGLQAGVLGALIMIGCLMLGAILDRRSIWVAPNLFSTVFFGSEVYRNQYLNTSLAGVALLIAVYGGLGALWGLLWQENQRPGLMAFGAICGLAVYFVFFRLILKHASPVITLYAPDRQLEIGHILWGMSLGKSPALARRIAGRTSRPAVPEAQEVII